MVGNIGSEKPQSAKVRCGYIPGRVIDATAGIFALDSAFLAALNEFFTRRMKKEAKTRLSAIWVTIQTRKRVKGADSLPYVIDPYLCT